MAIYSTNHGHTKFPLIKDVHDVLALGVPLKMKTALVSGWQQGPLKVKL